MTLRPDNSNLYGMGPCDLPLQQDIFSGMASARLPANHTFIRTPKADPTSLARAVSGALLVDEQEFRLRCETGALGTPLVGRSYEVWEL